MKNIFKYLAVAAIGIALTGLVACEPETEARGPAERRA